MEYNPDKRAANAAKQRKFHNGLPKTPTKALQKRMDALYALVSQGETIGAACAKIGIQRNTYEQWRVRFPKYAQKIDRARAKLASGDYPPCPFTPEFREKYLAEDYDPPINPPHLLQAIEFINNIGPTQFGLILMPPGHAKSSLTEDLLTATIANDPESRCVIISKTQQEAIKRLLKVQARMEDIDFYEDYITTWGPFKPEGRSQRPWAATKMTVARKTPRQRDYSLQAIGVQGQIQGQSIDWAILDDIADDTHQSAQLIEAQANYIRQSVNTRFRKTGRGLCIGTRQHEMDIYRKLMDEDFFDHVLILPAVFPDGSLLWPERYSTQDYENMKTKAGPRVWALTYQQEDVVSDGQAFPLDLIESCYDPTLAAQQVPPGSTVVVGVDPAATGFTAGVALAVDIRTKQRVVVDAWNAQNLIGDGGDRVAGVVQFILELCERYHASRLVLEDNSAFTYVSSNVYLRTALAEMGCKVETVKAGRFFYNDDAMSLALSTSFSNGAVRIPTKGQSLAVYKDLVFQLISWRPYDKKLIRDLVRAFYYAEVAATRLGRGERSHIPSSWGSDRSELLEAVGVS